MLIFRRVLQDYLKASFFFFFMQAFREMRMGFFTPFYLSIKFILNFEVNLMQGRAKL